MKYHERNRPLTVTRGLPYVIGKDYQRLIRLARYIDHNIPAYHSHIRSRMIFQQYMSLYNKVYKLARLYRVQCIVVATLYSRKPQFEDYWIRGDNPTHALRRFLHLYEGLYVVDIFDEQGNMIEPGYKEGI